MSESGSAPKDALKENPTSESGLVLEIPKEDIGVPKIDIKEAEFVYSTLTPEDKAFCSSLKKPSEKYIYLCERGALLVHMNEKRAEFAEKRYDMNSAVAQNASPETPLEKGRDGKTGMDFDPSSNLSA